MHAQAPLAGSTHLPYPTLIKVCARAQAPLSWPACMWNVACMCSARRLDIMMRLLCGRWAQAALRQLSDSQGEPYGATFTATLHVPWPGWHVVCSQRVRAAPEPRACCERSQHKPLGVGRGCCGSDAPQQRPASPQSRRRRRAARCAQERSRCCACEWCRGIVRTRLRTGRLVCAKRRQGLIGAGPSGLQQALRCPNAQHVIWKLALQF